MNNSAPNSLSQPSQHDLNKPIKNPIRAWDRHVSYSKNKKANSESHLTEKCSLN